MKKLALLLSCLFVFGGLAVLTSCDSADNVASCEAWVDSVSCGTTDFSTLVNCSVYEETTCDISDYFTCLTDNGTCDEATGVYDSSGWAQCASQATCD